MKNERGVFSPVLRLSRISKAYGKTTVLQDVSLDVATGTFAAVVGGSGAGKSTLLRIANGLIWPDEGTVTFDGVLLAKNNSVAMRRRIGFVFQSYGLFPHMTVAQNIGVGKKVAGEALSDTEVGCMLDLVELPRAVAQRRPHELSGGQQQRVGIARALAPSPQLLLLDEPFAALDPVTRDALATTMSELHVELGLTTVMVTHDITEALLLADRVLVMEAGRLAADETPTGLLAGGGGKTAQALLEAPRRRQRRLTELSK
ncbi:MAG: ABC transporter ATP-binding protein [Methylocystis sp.]